MFHGKMKAVTFSYDDGARSDLRLAEIFDKYGVKGTFNLCGGMIGNPDRLTYQRLLAMCAARYGLRWKSIPDSNSRWVDVRNALRQGHMIVAGQAAGGPLFVTADGGTRPYKNGHTIMFYRYTNGRFYA